MPLALLYGQKKFLCVTDLTLSKVKIAVYASLFANIALSILQGRLPVLPL